MTDVRDRVEEDRGLLKRIQLHIPGFSGYRKREDIRQADSILRLQLADRLKEIRSKLEGSRQSLVDNFHTKALEPLGRAIFECQEFEGMIRHAEQGYSGFSFAIRIETSDLDRIYEFDLSLLDGMKSLEDKARELHTSTDKATDIIREFSSSMDELKSTFKRRWNSITGTEVR
jgi:hypothetical protein